MKNNWQTKTLGEVCKKSSSNVSLNKIQENEGEYPIYGAKGFIKKVDFYHQDKPYISIIKDGAGVGRVNLQEEKSSVIGTLQYLVPKDDIDINFLYYFLLGIDFEKYSCGAAIPHIYFKDYEKEELKVPPLATQKAIVKILDEVFESISKSKENTEKNLKNAKELFESYLEEIFSNSKEDWEEKKLGDCIEVLTDFVANGSFATLRENVKYYKEKNFALLVRLKDLRKNLKESSDNIYVSKSAYNFLKKSSLHGGEFLIANVGANIGDMYLMPKLNFPATLGPNMFLVKFNSKVNIHFVSSISEFLIKPKIVKASQGAAQPKINKNQFRDISIPLPPLTTQKQIVQKLDSLSSEIKQLEQIYAQKLKDLEELKKSMLQKAFSGELTKE